MSIEEPTYLPLIFFKCIPEPFFRYITGKFGFSIFCFAFLVIRLHSIVNICQITNRILNQLLESYVLIEVIFRLKSQLIIFRDIISAYRVRILIIEYRRVLSYCKDRLPFSIAVFEIINTELIELVPDDSCEDPQEAALQADTKRCVSEAVETLPEKQRAAIVGFNFEGKPIKAISQSARQSAFFALRRNGKLLSLITRYNDALYRSSGARSFRYTHESAVERAVIQRERILDQINGALPTRKIG